MPGTVGDKAVDLGLLVGKLFEPICHKYCGSILEYIEEAPGTVYMQTNVHLSNRPADYCISLLLFVVPIIPSPVALSGPFPPYKRAVLKELLYSTETGATHVQAIIFSLMQS